MTADLFADLDRIRGLAAAATDGPWEADGGDTYRQHVAEQIAALDGASSTEWGVDLGDGRGIAVWSEKTCRMFAAEVSDATLVSRQVTEWRAAE